LVRSTDRRVLQLPQARDCTSDSQCFA